VLVIANAQALATSLRAQAVAVQNLRALVPIVLDRHSTQYSQWRGLFLNTLGKYALADHINLDAAPQDVGDWDAMECTVRSWIYASITPDLLSDVMTPGASARRVWLAIEDQFLGNMETRALILDAEFRNFVQGDLPIADYCRKLKSMADSLGDLGEPVPDRTLVLSVLRGLNEKFGYMGAILKRQKPFPSSEVKNDLLVEEISMATPTAPSQAFFTAAPRPPVGSVLGGPAPANPPASNSGPKKKNRNKKIPLRPDPRSTIRGLGLSRCGLGRRVGHFLVLAPLVSNRSSSGGPLRRSSTARLLPSRLSSVGQSGLPSPA
jgi:hypothetical protein